MYFIRPYSFVSIELNQDSKNSRWVKIYTKLVIYMIIFYVNVIIARLRKLLVEKSIKKTRLISRGIFINFVKMDKLRNPCVARCSFNIRPKFLCNQIRVVYIIKTCAKFF